MSRFQVQCSHCNSRILCEQTGDYLKKEMQLPRPDSVEEALETLDEFWKVVLFFMNLN